MKCDYSPADQQAESCDRINQRIDRLVNDYEEKILLRINGEYRKKTKWSDRLADRIAAFGGSWKFIIIFSVFLTSWMVWNVLSFTRHFDNPPYILLNLILSFIAAFQAPVIMMSQNRHAEQDKQEAVIDFAINYKSEQEIDDIQSHLHRLEADMKEIKSMLHNMVTGMEKK
ncbi:DUF1003 domain-containing protein [Desulfotomaculum copahuensis]|uniref:Cyclic nucleotide-binding protein n=1 Tax=Desulfotomaculum copahuensis TaxID=1838280 RepID=A0A1B7LAT8_9FIRM|nr:DUF1003 domain-containing protein [Desulfotomaculum copahuensis]OAT79416.1 hypothetical protein A6M21_01415 [Desulfotomaculum copahuensis]